MKTLLLFSYYFQKQMTDIVEWELVSWSLMSLFSTNMAISETIVQRELTAEMPNFFYS